MAAGEQFARFRWTVRTMFLACVAFSYVVECLGCSSDATMCHEIAFNTFLAYLPVEISMHMSVDGRPLAFWPAFRGG